MTADETTWYVVAKFRGSLNPDERQELIAALWAQFEDVSDVEVHLIRNEPTFETDQCYGACGQITEQGEEHHCDLAPAGESATVLLALLPVLADVVGLIDACIRLSADQGSPRWIEIDDERIHWNAGVMRTADFREHYAGTCHEDSTPRYGAVG